MLFEFFQLIKCFFAIFCLKYGLVKAIFYGMMQFSERQKCHFRASNFKKFPWGRGRHAPGPPSYAEPRILLQSDFKLDPPLGLVGKFLNQIQRRCECFILHVKKFMKTDVHILYMVRKPNRLQLNINYGLIHFVLIFF